MPCSPSGEACLLQSPNEFVHVALATQPSAQWRVFHLFLWVTFPLAHSYAVLTVGFYSCPFFMNVLALMNPIVTQLNRVCYQLCHHCNSCPKKCISLFHSLGSYLLPIIPEFPRKEEAGTSFLLSQPSVTRLAFQTKMNKTWSHHLCTEKGRSY